MLSPHVSLMLLCTNHSIFDPHSHQYSTACTDTLHTIPSTEGKKTSEVHYSEDYKPEAIGGQNTEPQVTDSLPGRLINPDQYRPILPVEGELAHQQDSTESGNHERCLIPVYTYSSVN